MTMAKTPRFLTSASKTPKFPMFVLVSGQPVDLTVPSDSFMVGIDTDGFEIFVGGVFADPVRVEDSQAAHGFADSFFSDGLDFPLEFERVDTFVDGFAVGGTFGGESLSAAPSDSDAEWGRGVGLIYPNEIQA